jgi:hypothetical protein
MPEVMVQEYGAVPPETPIGELYGTFTVPFGKVVTVNTSGVGLITTWTGPVTVPFGLLESVPVTVTVLVPGVVGVPLIVQFAMVNPAGSVPAVIVHI